MSCRRGEQRLGGGVARSESLNGGEGGRRTGMRCSRMNDLHLVMSEDFW